MRGQEVFWSNNEDGGKDDAAAWIRMGIGHRTTEREATSSYDSTLGGNSSALGFLTGANGRSRGAERSVEDAATTTTTSPKAAVIVFHAVDVIAAWDRGDSPFCPGRWHLVGGNKSTTESLGSGHGIVET